MNPLYPHSDPERDPNAILYLLGIALIAGMAFAMWLLV